MADIIKKIQTEVICVEKTLSELNQGLSNKNPDNINLRGIGSCLLDIYMGMENILKTILKDHKIQLPQSATWHKQLIETAIDRNIIGAELATALYKYLGFRHVFIHIYGFRLLEDDVLVLAKDISSTWKDFLSAIKKHYPV